VQSETARVREGFLYGLVAYGWWGLVPLYFKALEGVDAAEILAHRIVWSMVFLAALLSLAGRWGELKRCFTSPALLRVFLATSVLIAVNWFVYIYSVEERQLVQSSLGYFMTPLVSVGLGMLFFKERLRSLQAVALVLAVTGVLILTIAVGELPWIALILAVSFGLYGLLRKVVPVDGLVGLSVETLLLLPFAAGFLLWRAEEGAFGRYSWSLDVLLFCSGVVTAVPLMCFAQAARRLPLSTLGFLQYLAPSLQFLLAVLLFHEDFAAEKAVSFGCIWGALVVFSIDTMREYRQRAPSTPPVENL
jgi:chloramphenicol-sensitive protein RarD